MRVIILSALMGLGIGLAGIPAANAAPISGLSSAVEGGLLHIPSAELFVGFIRGSLPEINPQCGAPDPHLR